MSDLLNNLTALQIANVFNLNQFNLEQNILNLSTGLRINTPAQDVAGNAIAQQFQAGLSILNQGTLNAQDITSVSQVAQGALGQINNILQQLNTLAAQATNGVLGPLERQDIQAQVNQLTQQINTIAGEANFAGIPLLQGNIASPQAAVPSTIQIATNAFVGAQGQSLIANVTVSSAALNPPSGTTSFLNEAFQFNIVQNGASAVTVEVTASGNPNVIVASVGVNLSAPPPGLTPITITSSAPGGATFVANLNFQNLTTNDIPNLTSQEAFVSTTAFTAAVTANNALEIQVGSGAGQIAQAGIPSALSSNIFSNQALNVSTPIQAQGALVQIQQALNFVTNSQSVIGALQNQAQALIQNNNILNENLLASTSRITDINAAVATTNLVTNQILAQVGSGLLSQANLLPQSILKLFP